MLNIAYAPPAAKLTLGLSLLVALLLTVGALLARRRCYSAHRWVQTAAVLLNLALVGAVMLGSFGSAVVPGLPAQLNDPFYGLALLHGLVGLVTLVLGCWVLLVGHGLVPRGLRFRSYKPYMRAAYTLYMLATALGCALFLLWYGDTAPTAALTQPEPHPSEVLPTRPAGVQPQIEALLRVGPGLPERQGYAVGLREQADALVQHAELLARAQQAGDLPGLHRYAERSYNLIVGSLDAHFGDLDGDGRAQNPGDGFGLLPNGRQPGYIQALEQTARAAAQAPDASAAIRLHAGHVQVCAANLSIWADEARKLALYLSTADSTDSAQSAAASARLMQLSRQIARGDDRNGDGVIAPIAGEGGALVAYEHARYMAGLE